MNWFAKFVILFFSIGIRVSILGESNFSDISEIELPFTPCYDTQLCNRTFPIPFVESKTSRKFSNVNSTFFLVKENDLECPEHLIHTRLNYGSFALLPDITLIHMPTKIVFTYDYFSFKPVKSEEYGRSNKYEPDYKLEAEVCLVPPDLNFCCSGGQMVTQKDEGGTYYCEGNENSDRILPSIYFDGRNHDWLLNGTVKEFPSCSDSLTVVKLGNLNNHGTLRLVEEDLQMVWKIGVSNKVFVANSSSYCIAQLNDYGFTRAVAAFCESSQDENRCSEEVNVPCFSKCCQEDSNFDLETLSCSHDYYENTWLPDEKEIGFYSYMIGEPMCEHYSTVSMNRNVADHTQLIRNGSLYVVVWNETISAPYYCVDFFRNRSHLNAMSLVCFDKADDIPHYGAYPLVCGILIITFSLVLLATLIALLVRIAMYSNHQKATTVLVVPVGCIVFYIFFSSIYIGIQQILQDSIPATVCFIAALIYEGLSLASVCQMLVIVIEQCLRSFNILLDEIWQTVLMVVCPFLMSMSIVTLTQLFMKELVDGCPLDANFIDPWQSFPITAAYALILLSCPALLFITNKNNNTSDCMVESNCCSDGSWTNETKEGDSEADGETVDRWWLTVKLWATFLFLSISYISVWQKDAIGFWLFADINVMLKCIVISVCLVRFMNPKIDETACA